jgi:O-antigen/teichoic acid export membrane protein
VSWASLASGLIFVAPSMFQAMRNTVPSLISSAVRIMLAAALTLILALMPGFALSWIWYLSVGSVFVQLFLSLALLRPEFARRLRWNRYVA